MAIIRNIQTMGLFMICLIMTLPFVSAQQLNVVRFSGKDASTGYAKTNDKLTAEVRAMIPYDTNIKREQVQIWVGEAFAFFDSCEKEANTTTHTCIFEQDGFTAYSPLEVVFKLIDDDGKVVSEKQQTLKVDSVRPVVKSFTIIPIISTGRVKVNYEIEDYGLSINDVTGCSGIRKISITSGGEELISETGREGQCKRSNSVDLDISNSTAVCIIAEDFVGYEGASKCIDVVVDKNAPSIELVSIKDSDGYDLTHLKGTMTATFTASITDDGELAAGSVKANFAGISTEKGDKPPSSTNGDLFYWDVPISGGTPCVFTITAKDKVENENIKQFSCNFVQDTTGPTVIGIVPGPAFNNFPVFGYGTMLSVEIEDKDNSGNPGIGMKKSGAYLDLSSLGMSTLKKSDLCVPMQITGTAQTGMQNAVTWKCSWILAPPKSTIEGEYTIKIAQATADDFENPVQSTPEFSIYYDNTPPLAPKIIDFRIIPGSSGMELPVRGNYVHYTVQSKDFTVESANFSDLGGPDDAQALTCIDNDAGTTDCEFEQLIDYSGPYIANITFTFTDEVGVSSSVSTALEIFGLDAETQGKYWKHEVECSPELLDRSTAAIAPPYVSCRVHLEPLRQDVETFAIQGPDVTDCKGDTSLTLDDVYVSNVQEGSREPFLNIKLSPRDYYELNLNITCPLNVFTKKVGTGTTIVPLPQVITVNISTGFYNVPQNDLYNIVDKKLERALDSGLSNAKWLGQLRQFMFYAEMICNIKSMVTSIIGVLYGVTATLGATGTALKATGTGAPAGETLLEAYWGTCHTEEGFAQFYGEDKSGFINFADSICSLVNCNIAFEGKSGFSKFTTNLDGGKLPWCNNFQALLEYFPALGQMSKTAGTPPLTIKDSLVWSSACLCLPGIIYNLEKLRQIDCYKAVCLNDEVKAQGFPVSHCEEMHGYMVCQFVVGQIWAAIPFTALFDKMTQMVVDIISDPVMIFTISIGSYCKQLCDTRDAGALAYAGCALYKTLAVVGESVGSIKQMTETKNAFRPPEDVYCDRADDIRKEFEKSKDEIQDATAELPPGAGV